MRSLVVEFSGKVPAYEEILPAFENYIPDRKPANVPAETRALALFNTHKFVYLY